MTSGRRNRKCKVKQQAWGTDCNMSGPLWGEVTGKEEVGEGQKAQMTVHYLLTLDLDLGVLTFGISKACWPRTDPTFPKLASPKRWHWWARNTLFKCKLGNSEPLCFMACFDEDLLLMKRHYKTSNWSLQKASRNCINSSQICFSCLTCFFWWNSNTDTCPCISFLLDNFWITPCLLFNPDVPPCGTWWHEAFPFENYNYIRLSSQW